jgi:hypothetical protein
MLLACSSCGRLFEANASRVNRASRICAPLYCGKACAGLARRLKVPPTAEEKRAQKAQYDMERRALLRDRIRKEKRAYYDANRPRILEMMKAYRKKRAPKHAEYCRRPVYVAWKSGYDRAYRAKRDFGEFATVALLLHDIEREINTQATRYEVYSANGTINKAQTRRRAL